MIDVARELQLLQQRLDVAVPPSAASVEAVLRRSRRARIANVSLAVIVVSSLVTGSFLAARTYEAAPRRAEVRAPSSEGTALSFRRAEGWDTVAFEWSGMARAWASTEALAREDRDSIAEGHPTGWPDASIEALPDDGIIVVVTEDLRSRNPLPPDDRWPERDRLVFDPPVGPGPVREGAGTGGASTSFGATVNGRRINALAFFGADEPSGALLEAANQQLARLIVEPAPPTTDAIDDLGLSMDLPDGWDAILYSWGPVPFLHASTTEIEELSPGRRSRENLGPDDLFILLAQSEYYVEYEALEAPPSFSSEDRCDVCEIMDGGASAPTGHALFYRSFAMGNRQFELWAEFGTATPTDEQIASVNDVLSTLQVEPRDPAFDGLGAVAEPTTSARVPAGWFEREDAFGEPAGIAAYGNWDLPAGGACGPEVALEELPSDGALVWAVQRVDAPNAGDYVHMHPSFRIDLQTPPGRWDCAAAAPSRLFIFRSAGQFLQVHVAFGPAAGSEQVAQAEALIHSLAG